MFSIHSQEEKIDVLGNFYWSEFYFFNHKWWKIWFLTWKMRGRLIHEFDLYTSKYGNCSFRGLWFKSGTQQFFLVLSTFDEHAKVQFLAKFKKILYMRFRGALNFRKFRVALNPTYFMEFSGSRRKYPREVSKWILYVFIFMSVWIHHVFCVVSLHPKYPWNNVEFF